MSEEFSVNDAVFNLYIDHTLTNLIQIYWCLF